MNTGSDGDHVVIEVALVVHLEARDNELLVVIEVGKPETEVGAGALTLGLTSSHVSRLDHCKVNIVNGRPETFEINLAGG